MDIDIEDGEIRDIWSELVEEAQKQAPLPDEITSTQFAEMSGLKVAQARMFLNAKVEAGEMERRMINRIGYYKKIT